MNGLQFIFKTIFYIRGYCIEWPAEYNFCMYMEWFSIICMAWTNKLPLQLHGEIIVKGNRYEWFSLSAIYTLK